MKEWMSEWVNKMNERTNEWDPPSATTAATLPQKIQGFAPESVWKPEFPRSRPRTLTNNFHDDDDVVDIWNRAPATVSCTFCRPHLPKVLRDPHLHLFNMFKWKSSSRFSPVHFLPTTPWSSRETAETEALLWRRKKYRISRPIMFSSLNSRVLDFLNTSQLLAWWCEQSGSRYSLVHIVPTSSSKSAPRPSVFLIMRLIVACNMCPCHEREVNVCHMNAAIKFISGWVGGKLYDEKFILTPLTSPTHPEWSLRYRHSRSPIRPPCWTRSVRGVAWHGSMFDVNFMLCWQCKMYALATHVESSIVKDVWHSQLKKDQARSEVGPVFVHATW